MEKDLTKQANKILETAKECGEESNFFATTLEKYITQLEILEKLTARNCIKIMTVIPKRSYVPKLWIH